MIDRNISDQFFVGVRYKLTPGKKYRAHLYRADRPISGELCMLFLKDRGALYAGAQALSLVYMQSLVPDSTQVVSFGGDNLKHEHVFSIYRYSGGEDDFFLTRWAGCFPLVADDSLLCISDLP